jgi:hypothetical protein
VQLSLLLVAERLFVLSRPRLSFSEFYYRQFRLSLAQYHLLDGQFITRTVQRYRFNLRVRRKQFVVLHTLNSIFALATIRTSQSESRFQPMRIRMFRYLHFDRGLQTFSLKYFHRFQIHSMWSLLKAWGASNPHASCTFFKHSFQSTLAGRSKQK